MSKLPLERLVATRVYDSAARRAVTYQGTEVISWDNETIRLNSGGWQTVTTKRRINQAARRWLLGFDLYQVRFEWWIAFPNEEPIRFYDGITLSRDRSQPHPAERRAAAAAVESEYNGWPNRATWNVMLWLNNEERYYRAYTAQARRRAFTVESAKRFVTRLFGYQSMFFARTPDGDPLNRADWPALVEAMNEGREE